MRAEEPVQQEAKESKLDDLLKERLATVRENWRLVTVRFKNGQGSVDQVREANRMVLEAELAVCGSDKDRIRVLEKSVAEAKNLENIADNFVKAGQGQVSLVLVAKADRLQAEIALERVKTKAAAAPGDGKAARESENQLALAEKQLAIKKAALLVAEAQVKKAVAKLDVAKALLVEMLALQSYEEKLHKRVFGLVNQGVIDNQPLDERQAKSEAAKARRAQAEGNVAEWESQVMLERARVELAKLEFEETELRMKQLNTRLRP